MNLNKHINFIILMVSFLFFWTAPLFADQYFSFNFIGPQKNIGDYAIPKLNPQKIYALTYDNTFQMFVSDDEGNTWTQKVDQTLSGQYPTISISDTDPNIIFITSSTGLFISKDGGSTWVKSLPTLNNWSWTSVRGNMVIAGRGSLLGAKTLYKSLDLGDSWVDITPLKSSFSTGSIDPIDNNFIYAQGSYNYLNTGNTSYWKEYFYRSVNGGQSFDMINCAQIRSIDYKNDENKILFVTGDGLYLSLNKAQSLQKISNYFFNAKFFKNIIIATDDNLYGDFFYAISRDEGKTWEKFTNDVAKKPFATRKIMITENHIYLSSYYGLYRAPVSLDGICTYTLSPGSDGFAAASALGVVTVTPSLSSCSWTAVSNASWITITSGSSSTGSGTVSYSIAANRTGSNRTGTMTIGRLTFTITQSRSSGLPWLLLLLGN